VADIEYLKPINLLDGRAYRTERLAVVDAICDIFVACGFDAIPPIHDYGCWRHPHYLDPQGYMVPYMSVKWYIEQAREASRRRVNAQRLMTAFRNEPWRQDDSLGDHYDVLLLDEPIFDAAEQEHFGLDTTPGYAVDGIAVVLSTADIDGLGRVTYSLLKTLAMREMAHAFGVPGFRRDALTVTPRLACTHPCVLGPCIDMPADLEALTDLRLAGPPFCDLCLAELKAHLGPPHAAAHDA
jgi:hypothetical protein